MRKGHSSGGGNLDQQLHKRLQQQNPKQKGTGASGSLLPAEG